MSQEHEPSQRGRNKLLVGLPASEWELLQPHLEWVSLTHKHVFYEPGQPIPYVHRNRAHPPLDFARKNMI